MKKGVFRLCAGLLAVVLLSVAVVPCYAESDKYTSTGDLEILVELRLHRPYQLQDLRDALTGQEMGLDRNDAVVRSRQGVDRQKLML